MEANTECKSLWNRLTFLVITGASRGIGKNIAIAFSRLLHPESTILLIARSLPNLEETKKEVLKINPTLDVKLQPLDLSKPEAQLYRNLLSTTAGTRHYELYFLIHNAASIVVHLPASKMDDVQLLHDYMSLNLYSVTALTSAFLDLFQKEDRIIINMSSIYGLEARKGATLYSVGKAAREMYFKVMAEENPSINILNYSPGPVETDMLLKFMEECFHPEVKTQLQEMQKTKILVKMDDTIKKLINVLTKGAYQNGAHISYFDEI